MTKRILASPYWEIEGQAFDSSGILRWFPLFQYHTEKRANRTLQMIRNSDRKTRGGSGVAKYGEFRVVVPGRTHLDILEERMKEDKKASKGKCPSCGKKSGKNSKGARNGKPAIRCGKCSHVWMEQGL